MDIESRLSISFYKTISAISEAHQIYIVQNINNNKIYIKKLLSVYNKDIYDYLIANPIPHTPRIYEVYEDDNRLTVIEEYISGDTIEQLLDSGYVFDDKSIGKIIMQLCDIVRKLHCCEPAIIHRDIKPSNIIITPSNELFLLDFNAAKYLDHTKHEDTRLLGTKGYAAPEQYGFGVSTIQTDIYAIGMLLNTLVNGSFSSESVSNSIFSRIIQKCTQMNPQERYHNIDEIIKALDQTFINSDIPKPKRKWQTYLPPGFQKLSPLSMILSSIGYIFIFWLCLSLKVEDATPSVLWVERIFCLIMFLSIIFCSANYQNVQSCFSLCRVRNRFLHFLAVVLLDIIVMFAILIFMFFIIELIS